MLRINDWANVNLGREGRGCDRRDPRGGRQGWAHRAMEGKRDANELKGPVHCFLNWVGGASPGPCLTDLGPESRFPSYQPSNPRQAL